MRKRDAWYVIDPYRKAGAAVAGPFRRSLVASVVARWIRWRRGNRCLDTFRPVVHSDHARRHQPAWR